MKHAEKLGRPSVKIAGFQLWVHGRQFPDSQDFYDGNWLQVTANCSAPGASVWVWGPILMATDIALWAQQCEALYKSLFGEAILHSYEPELCVTLSASDKLGHIKMRVEITPDNLNQEHISEFEIDQNYLPVLIRECRAIVVAYPIRDPQRGHSI